MPRTVTLIFPPRSDPSSGLSQLDLPLSSTLTANDLDLVGVLVLKSLEVLVLGGKTALGRNVDEDERLVLVVGELDGLGPGGDLDDSER
jgi:hypothetical protein